MKHRISISFAGGLVLVVVAINFLTMPATEYPGDAQAVRMQAITFLTTGCWSVAEEVALQFGPPGNYFYHASDGSWYPKFGQLNTLMYLPFLALEKIINGRLDFASDHVLYLNVLNLFCAAAAAFYLVLIVRRYSSSRWTAVLFVAANLYATFWWHYLRAQTFESFIVPMVLGLFFHFVSGNDGGRFSIRHYFFSGIFLGALCLSKTVFVVCVPVMTALLALPSWPKWRPGPVVALGLPVLLGLFLLGTTNRYRFGSVLNTGYTQWAEERALFSGNIMTGLSGYLFGRRTSLLIYFPALLFALPFWPRFFRERKADATAIISLGTVLILAHAARSNWSGATSYGPRYLLVVAPLIAIPAVFFPAWIRGASKPFGTIVSTVAILALGWSLILQVAVNSLPFHFANTLQSVVENSGDDPAFDYLRAENEGVLALNFLAYARGWPSNFSGAVADRVEPEIFAQLEGLKAETRFNYYWFHRPIERKDLAGL